MTPNVLSETRYYQRHLNYSNISGVIKQHKTRLTESKGDTLCCVKTQTVILRGSSEKVAINAQLGSQFFVQLIHWIS